MKLPSIRLTGPILFILPVLVLIVSFSLLAAWQGHTAIDALTSEIVDQVGERVENEVNDYLAQRVQVTRQGAMALADGDLDPTSLREWRKNLRQFVAPNPKINSLTFGNADGHATWVIRYPDEEGLEWAIKDSRTPKETVQQYHLTSQGDQGQRLADLEHYNTHERRWFKEARDSHGPIWTSIYSWKRASKEETTLGLSYSRPIRHTDGRFVGVLSSDVPLVSIAYTLRAARPSQSSTMFLVENDGKLLASSTKTPVLSSDETRVAATEAQDSVLSGVAQAIVTTYGSFAQVAESKALRVHVQGAPYRVKVWPFIREPFIDEWGIDWCLVIIIPEPELMAGVNQLRRQGWLWGGLIALGTLLLGVLVSWSVVRPVTQLATSVQEIGAGNLEKPVAVGGYREFDQLTKALNQMIEDLKDHLRIRQSLNLAMEIQQKLLPDIPPTVPRLDVAGHSTYCDETGGDYYDFLLRRETDDHRLVVVLGDVMGHGIAAALLMATARGILRSRAAEPGSLGQLLTHVNQLLVKDTGGERFMTMILLVIDPKGGWIRLASAGHDAPILYDPTSDTFPEPPGSNGLPLGLLAEEQYQEIRLEGLSSGHIFLVGTDGLWETHAPDGQIYGKDRLRDVLRQYHDRPADQIANAVTTDVRQFRGDAHQDDDITFVVIKFC